VGNYVIADPSNLGNFMIADTWRPDPQFAPVKRNNADWREWRRSNVYRHRTSQPDPTATTPAAAAAAAAAAREWWLSS
jgi:hypothetical protein